MDQIDGPPHGNYDLPPPPEVLTNNNFDGQSLSSNSVTVREFTPLLQLLKKVI